MGTIVGARGGWGKRMLRPGEIGRIRDLGS
jgi:hypothetical protein